MAPPGYTLKRRLARQRRGTREARVGDDTPSPGFWSRFDAGMTRARSLALSTAVLLVLGVVGWSVAQELIRDPVIIEPLAVPEDVAKAGWTGEVLARQIRDGVREIDEGVTTRRVRADYLFDREQLDIVLPGGLVSIRTLVTVVRGVLGRPARRVAGEVIQLDKDRDRQAACPGAPQGTSPAGTRYRLVGRLSTAARPWTACADAVGDLPRMASRELVLATTPYIYAAFLYKRDPGQAKTVAEAILADKKARADHPSALTLLGIMLHDKKQFAQAIEMYQEALRRDPKLAVVYNNWGAALSELGRPKEAIGKYEEAVLRDPYLVIAYVGWGDSLLELKQPEEAIVKYRGAVYLDPDYAAAYNNWGNALLGLKWPEEAIKKYEEALRRDPDLAMAYYNWGIALVDLNRLEEAIGKYQEVLRRDPDYADAYYNWALALTDLGRDDEAAAKRAIYDCLSQGRTSGECLASTYARASLSTQEKRAPAKAR